MPGRGYQRDVVGLVHALRHRGPALEGDTLHYEWPHGLGEVITALAQAGLVIDNLTETDVHPMRRWPWMVQTDYGWWRQEGSQPRVPTLYGLKASKPH